MNQNKTSFDDMEDDFPSSEDFNAKPRDYLEAAHEYIKNRGGTQRIYEERKAVHRPTDRAEKLYSENCPACKGSGKFTSYTGRVVGNCFKCEGKGVLTFKTSPESRASGRQSAERTRMRKAQELSENIAAFKEQNADVYGWIESNLNRNFDFADSLHEQLHRKGELSEGQIAAVLRCMEREKARTAERVANAPAADAEKLENAFKHAQSSGLKFPSLYFSGFRFSPASANSANAGAIYAKAHDGTYLGKVAGGKFFKSRDCSAEDEQDVLRVVNDPFAAAVEFGKMTGHCCVCNRLLTDPESVNRGIGPICAERFGWL
jgi:uncharacterized Zn finger protein (UPF0148 family)